MGVTTKKVNVGKTIELAVDASRLGFGDGAQDGRRGMPWGLYMSKKSRRHQPDAGRLFVMPG
jgi:hypothetical protein